MVLSKKQQTEKKCRAPAEQKNGKRGKKIAHKICNKI